MEMKPYIVCSGASGRAVMFGWSKTKPKVGKPHTLHNARMVLYWAAECGGLLGLAAQGPKGATRLTHVVGEAGATVTEFVAVSSGAAKEIEQWPAV